MKIIPLELPDALIIESDIYRDDRGYFTETFNFDKFQEAIGEFNIIQINQSKSKCGVIRALHYQEPPFAQAKLVYVVKGEVLDVIVDIRKDSPTFGQHASVLLSGTNKTRVFVPKGFAHGFITLTKDAIFNYCVNAPYAPQYESGIKFDDKKLNIDWKKKRKIIVNERDRNLKSFDEIKLFTKEEFNVEYPQFYNKSLSHMKIKCRHENIE